ncbi:MAG: hypothetical protein KAY24_13040 [Candidatus Eisenbacteria sp.]|nr:hypothetical protein [Candidatus Eisenbacteria bacterium]
MLFPYYIRLYSSTIEAKGEDLVVLSFPGPDRSIKMDDLHAGRAVSRRYRNRRIDGFLGCIL